jgi:hypothetical protein
MTICSANIPVCVVKQGYLTYILAGDNNGFTPN